MRTNLDNTPEGNYTIGIITCYFGRLPWFFAYFIHSAQYNPSVSFFIVSDDLTYSHPLPNNVNMIYLDLEKISCLITNKLGFKVQITNPYKMCDFKPLYGLIFRDLIGKCDFWGYSDIDIILGDIRHFITNDILTNYDIITVRHDYLTGYFQLFRNNEKTLNLFKHSKDYIRVFTTDKHYCFDETNFQFTAFREGKHWTEINSEIESMMHVVKKLQEQGEIRAYFEFHVAEGLPGNLTWENGKLFYLKKFEVILYHLIYFKKAFNPRRNITSIPTKFKISSKKIIHKSKANLHHAL